MFMQDEYYGADVVVRIVNDIDKVLTKICEKI